MIMALLLYFFVIFCLSTLGSQEFQKCADPNCKDPISEAVAEINYNADVEGKVSLAIGDKVVVYSKTGYLWGVEVNGKRGFVPKDFLREKRTFHKNLEYEVPMKLTGEKIHESIDTQQNSDHPEISKSYIIDGTVVYTNSTDDLDVESINPTSTVFDQSTVNENLKVTPIKLNTDYHGISPHKNIRSDKNEIQENLHEKSVEETKGDNELNLLKETAESEREKHFSSESGVQDDENKDSEYDVEESDEDLEDDEEEDETEEARSEETNSKGEKIFSERSHEQIDAGNIVVEPSQAAVDDRNSGNNTASILSAVDNFSNNGTLGDNTFVGNKSPESVLTSQSEHLEENDIEMSNITKDSKESETSVKTEGTLENEKSEVTTGTEETGETMGNKETDGTIGNKEAGGTVGSKETERTVRNEESETSISNEDVGENSKVMGDDGRIGKEEMLKIIETTENHVAKNLETEETALNEGAKKTEDIKKTVYYENNESAPSPSDNSMMPSESSDNSMMPSESSDNSMMPSESSEKDEIEEQTLSKHEEDCSGSIESKKIPLKKSELESESLANEVNRHAAFSPRRELFNQIMSEEYSSVVTTIDNRKNIENDVSEDSRHTYEDTGNVYEAEKISEEKKESEYETNDQIDDLSKVQGTCDAESSGCIPSGDLPEQLPPTLDVEQGWFATLKQLELPYLTRTSIMEGQRSSFDTLVFLMITGSSIVLFLLGFYYLEKHRRDGSLLAKISSLERELMVAAQEKFALNDELEKVKERRVAGGDFVSSGSDDVAKLRTELEECKIARAELEDQVMSLEKELETATEAGLELNKMMSELLSQQHGSDTKDLMQSVEHLQKQLDSQQTTISTMNERLTAKTQEYEKLMSEMSAFAGHVLEMEEQHDKVRETLKNLQKEKLEVENDFKAKNQSIEKQLMETLASKSAESQRLQAAVDSLQDMLDEMSKNLTEKEGEVSVLRECLSQVECLTNDEDSRVSLESLLDVGKLRVQIECLSKERDDLKEKLQGEEDARKLLEDHMKIVSEEVSTLRTKYEEADHGKAEAQTRLEILSNYFKEKETQLQKELGLQEAMYIQKEGDALTTTERIKAFQEEIENYKSQNEILKKEIIDQEKSMKSKIAILEKEVHENWIAARQMERRLEESKREASQLRNRLTLSGRRLVGTIPGPEVGKSPDRELEYNGEMSASPAHLGESQELQSSPMHYGHPASPPLLPPSGQQITSGPFPSMPLYLPLGAPPLPFPMPPPPGNIFPEDLRPPPLGRMSSPPPEPHSSFSPYNNSPPMSPHGRPYRSPLHYEDSPSRFRQPLQSSSSFSYSSPYPSSKWDEPPRSSFRPLHRDSPREPKGSTISSGHSSESLDKGSRHSDRV